MTQAPEPAPDKLEALPALFVHWIGLEPRECPNCRYALSGLTRPRCPECGVELVLAVRPADPRSRAYFTGLIGLASGLGFSGTMALLMTVFLAFGIKAPSSGRFYAFSIGGAIVFATALYCWRHRRLDFRQLSAAARGRLALLCWLLALAYVVAFAWAVDIS